MNNIYPILLIFVLLISACKSKEQENSNSINISVMESEQLDIEDFFCFDSAKLIPLETSDECLISGNYQVKYTKEDIFILDHGLGNILRFDKQGRFINKIGSLGKGPEEYYRPADIIVDEQLRVVEVLCEPKSTICRYNYQGHFISRTSHKFPSHSFVKDKTGGYYFYRGINSGYSNYRVSYAKNNKVIELFREDGGKPSVGLLLEHNSLINNGTSIYLKQALLPSVYKLNGGELNELFRYDFGNAPIQSSDYNNYRNTLELLKELDNRGFYSITNLYINNNKLVAKIQYQKTNENLIHYLHFFDSQNNTISVVKSAQNDKCFLVRGALEDYLKSDQFIYSIKAYDAHLLSKYFSSISNINENDNPIVIILSRKNQNTGYKTASSKLK